MLGSAPREDDNVRRLLGYLGGAWTLEVLSALGGGGRRFNELKQDLDIPANTLARVLKTLERDGFVSRFESPALARQVEYQLTAVGRSFESVVEHCRHWAHRHEAVVDAAQRAFDVDGTVAGPDAHPAALATPAYRNLSYAGLVVSDIEAAAAGWEDVFNLQVSPILDRYPTTPNGKTVAVRSAWLAFRNLGVNLIQPVDRRGPFRDHLSKRGPGFHHIGFYVSGQIGHWIQRLKGEGGRQVLGGLDGKYAEFDLRAGLGTGVEVIPRSGAAIHAGAYRSPGGRRASSRSVDRLTINVVDIDLARRGYRAALGLSMSLPERKSFTLRTPRGTRKGVALETTIRQNAISLAIVQLETRSAVKAMVDRQGSSFRLMGLRATEPLDRLIPELERKGGRVVAEDDSNQYVAVDFLDRLGVILEFRAEAGHPRA